MPIDTSKPLWTCPKCKQKFVTKNLSHSCTQFTVDEFFAGKNPDLIKLYRKFIKFIKKCGPVYININKTRISIQAKMRFCGISRVLKDGLQVPFLLSRQINHSRTVKHVFYPPVYYGHYVIIKSEKDLDNVLLNWLKESYKMGMREHLLKNNYGKK